MRSLSAPVLQAKFVGYEVTPAPVTEPNRRPSWALKIGTLLAVAVLAYAWTGVLLTWIGSLGTGDFFTLVGNLGARF